MREGTAGKGWVDRSAGRTASRIALGCVFLAGLLPAMVEATVDQTGRSRVPMFWIDPMVPGSHFDHGGKSPFMDMELVPVYETDPSMVSMTAAEAANLAIRTVKISRHELHDSIRTLATISYDERNVQDVTVRVNARVSQYHYPIHEGYLVTKGQALFELQSPEIYQYLSDYLNLVSNSERLALVSTDTTHVIAQSKTTLQWRGIPDETIEQVIKSGKATDRFTVRSPVTGIVLKRFVEQDSLVNAGVKTGQFTTYGTPVVRIADISYVYADAQIFSDDMDRLKVGMPCAVQPQGSNGASVTARISYVYPTLKGGARYGLARIALDNRSLSLKPGTYAEVRLDLPDGGSALAVPAEAVVESADESWVFVRIDAEHFQKRVVKLAEPQGDEIRVLHGLEEGEEVATGGAVFFLNSDLAMKEPTGLPTE